MKIKNEINNKTDNSKYKFILRKIIGPTNFSKLTNFIIRLKMEVLIILINTFN